MKLFRVSCSIDVDMVVVAENEEQARKVGKENWLEEMANAGLEPSGFSATEVRRRSEIGFLRDEDLDGIYPWEPEGHHWETLTIGELLRKQGIVK